MFAPTDDAFSKLPAGTVEQLLRPENRDTLRAILTYHVTLGRLASKDLPTLAMWRTLEGDMLTFAWDGTSTVVEGARIVKADVAATNGTIHVIDRVLLPRAVAKALAARSTAPVPGGHDTDASSGSVGDVLRLAIERGVPLYNRGQHEACAAVYEVAARALLASPSTPGDARTVLRAGLADMARQSDAAEQAWALRRAFDRVLAAGA